MYDNRPLFAIIGLIGFLGFPDVARGLDGDRPEQPSPIERDTRPREQPDRVDDGGGIRLLSSFVYPKGLISKFAISPDGLRVVATLEMRMWDARTGHEPRTRPRPSAPVANLAFSPDGSRIISAGSADLVEIGSPPSTPSASNGSTIWSWVGEKVELWETSSGRRIHELFRSPKPSEPPPVASPVRRSVLDPKSLSPNPFAGLLDILPRVDPIEDRRRDVALFAEQSRVASFMASQGRKDPIIAVAYDIDNKHVAALRMNGSLTVWDTTSGREVLSLTEPRVSGLLGEGVASTSIGFSANLRRIVGVLPHQLRGLGSLVTWDTEARQVRILEGYRGGPRSAAINSDGTLVVAATTGSSLYLWDFETGKLVRRFLPASGKWPNFLAFSPDSKRIVSGYSSGLIRVWDRLTGDCIRTIDTHRGEIRAAVFLPDSTLRVVSGGGWPVPGSAGEVQAATGGGALPVVIFDVVYK